MNQEALTRICRVFEENEIDYKLLEHPACRTSAESAAVRAKAGVPGAIGAKALLCKMNYKDDRIEFNVLVLPGPSRLDSQLLKAQLPDLQRFRFATADEMRSLCNVVHGCMPPFAKTIFPDVDHLYVDESLLDYELVGFNAASLERSIVVRCHDFLRAATPTAILRFASFTTDKLS